jgi:hypothetical protein
MGEKKENQAPVLSISIGCSVSSAGNHIVKNPNDGREEYIGKI